MQYSNPYSNPYSNHYSKILESGLESANENTLNSQGSEIITDSKDYKNYGSKMSSEYTRIGFIPFTAINIRIATDGNRPKLTSERRKPRSSSRKSNCSVVMRQHSGVGIYQVINPVIRDTVKPIPTTNQIGLFPKKRFFRLDFE